MEYQRSWSWFSSVWPLILGLFVLQEIQAAHHRHVGQCIAVGTYNSLLELSAISFMDDVEILYYAKEFQQIIVKIPWVSKALGVDYITKINHLLVDHEPDIQWIIRILSKNDNNRNRNHTVQFVIDCEIDNDVELKSHFHMIWDGEEIYRMDEGIGHWESLKPEVKKYRSFWESPLWADIRKHYMNEYCLDLLRKIVRYSNLRNYVPPEVTVSRHVNPEGRIILSCTATGFYPRSILLRWKKNGELGIWGKETSSGILPNMDSTFYLRLTLELPPEDSGTGFTCVVEHTELKTPAMYPVPEKPTLEKPWVLTLSIMLSVILLMSCAGAFILWKKWKSDQSGQHRRSSLYSLV